MRHNRIYPQTLYVLVYNNHCFKLNSNEKSLVQKISKKEVVDEDKETYENLKNNYQQDFVLETSKTKLIKFSFKN